MHPRQRRVWGDRRVRLRKHVSPRRRRVAIPSKQTRAEAVKAASRLRADGGTAIGSWLTLAREQFDTASDRICHAILLTDGANEHETREELDRVLDECEGRFQCDCRGVGTDWQVSELRRIASKLLGTVDIIAEPEGLAADFRAMIENAMGKATGHVCCGCGPLRERPCSPSGRWPQPSRT